MLFLFLPFHYTFSVRIIVLYLSSILENMALQIAGGIAVTLLIPKIVEVRICRSGFIDCNRIIVERKCQRDSFYQQPRIASHPRTKRPWCLSFVDLVRVVTML